VGSDRARRVRGPVGAVVLAGGAIAAYTARLSFLSMPFDVAMMLVLEVPACSGGRCREALAPAGAGAAR
jgi:hypothetical protein